MATLSLLLADEGEPCMGSTAPRAARRTLGSIEGAFGPLLHEVDKYSRCLRAKSPLPSAHRRAFLVWDGYDMRPAGPMLLDQAEFVPQGPKDPAQGEHARHRMHFDAEHRA